MFVLSSNIKGGGAKGIIGGEGIKSTSTSLKVEGQTNALLKTHKSSISTFNLKKSATLALACPSRPDIDIDWLCMTVVVLDQRRRSIKKGSCRCRACIAVVMFKAKVRAEALVLRTTLAALQPPPNKYYQKVNNV